MSPERYPYNVDPSGLPHYDRRRAREETMCWRCNKVMPFYKPRCSCGAINANVDLEGAREQMEEDQRD